MPQFLEARLRAEATRKGFTGRRADAYVYETMNAIGAMHGNVETAKGAAMDAKHAKDVKKKRRSPLHQAMEILAKSRR